MFKRKVDGMHPGRTAEIHLNGERIGFIGQVHPTVQKELDLKDTYVFELSLKAVLEAATAALTIRSNSTFPIDHKRHCACGR